VFENGVLRGIFGFKRDEVMRSGENYIMWSLRISTVRPVFLCIKIEKRLAGHVACMWRREGYTGVWWGNMKERGHLGKTGADGRIILRWIIMDWELCVWTELNCPRIGTCFPLVNAVMNMYGFSLYFPLRTLTPS
jgi:hypothetical protein